MKTRDYGLHKLSCNSLKKLLRYAYNRRISKKLSNTDFSIIASNCNGSFLLHDLGIKFNSPFVNLWMKPCDFIKFLQNIQHYLNTKMSFVDVEDISYPVGVLDDIYIYFQHYSTKEEAEQKWIERSKRINFDNLFIMFTDRDGCTYQNLLDFDALPYKNKVVFTHIPYQEIQSAFYLKGWESEECVGMLFLYKSKYSIKKYYDDFDYITWLNNGRNIKK